MIKCKLTQRLVLAGMIAAGAMSISAETNAPALARPRAVIFFGTYTQWYKFDVAFPEFDLKIANAHSERVQDFPSVKTLFNSRFIVMSDINGGEFSEGQIQQIKTYVEQGGGAFFLGGPFTYGLGQLKEKGLAALLPVEELQPFDLKWEKSGISFSPVAEHKIVKGLDFGKQPTVWWIHRLKPRADAQVVMKAGDYPALILGRCGKGKIAVFTGTPMGQPGQGQAPFWEWEGWLKLLQNTAAWLGQKEPAPSGSEPAKTPAAGEVKS